MPFVSAALLWLLFPAPVGAPLRGFALAFRSACSSSSLLSLFLLFHARAACCDGVNILAFSEGGGVVLRVVDLVFSSNQPGT